jgi:hypothetical protein
MSKRRSDSILDGLTAGEQEIVFEHCEKRKLEDGVRWLKAELDVQLDKSNLGRWLEKVRNDRVFSDLLAEIRADADRSELVAESLGDVGRLNESNIKLLSQALFAAQRTGNMAAVKNAVFGLSMVVEALAKDRSATASVITAETSRSRFQFDAAKKALAHAAELQSISKSSGSEREKVERAIVRLFGQKPVGRAASLPA